MQQSVIIYLIIIYFKMTNCNRINSNKLEKECGEVIYVTALFRHGERSPMSSYPSDPHLRYPWPDGLGQLTKIGERRLYNLGKWFAKRYSKLTNQIRSHLNVTVQSSNEDRAIMSAQCFMAGFYRPPNESGYIDERLRWQPIPIHTVPQEHDNRITHGKECPIWERCKKKIYGRQQMRKKYDKYQKTFEYLQKHSELNFTRNDMIMTSHNVEQLYDILLVQNGHNLTLPKWTKKVYPKPLRTITDSLVYQDLSSLKVLRLASGPLFESIITNMEEKVADNSKKLFNFYSGHDSTIAFTSIALGSWDNNDPPYGSAIVFELRKTTESKYVTVFYKNSTTTEPHLMSIKGCKFPCTFKNFVRFARRIIPKNWESECQPKKNKTTYS